MPVQGDPISLNLSEEASRPAAGIARRTLLLGTSLLVYAALPSAAMAQQECGVPPPEGVVSCPSSGNPYLSGISYPGVVEDLTVILEPGVQTLDSVSVTSGTAGVDLRIEGQDSTFITTSQNGPTAAVVGVSTQGTVFVGVDDVLSTGDLAPGIFALGRGGTDIVADLVSTTGDLSPGVLAIGYSSGAYTVGPVTVTTNLVATQGDLSAGIVAVQGGGQYGGGGITVNSGTLLTAGANAGGIIVAVGAGSLYGTAGQITINSGALSTLGRREHRNHRDFRGRFGRDRRRRRFHTGRQQRRRARYGRSRHGARRGHSAGRH